MGSPDTAPPPAIEVRDLVRRFGAVTALDRVSLAIAPGEFFSLLGPSGCGKTTLLRIVAGLDLPDSGSLHLNGVDALPIPAHRRPVNTVFQSYALFPHLDVRGNVEFGLRMKKVPPDEMARRVDEIMDLVQVALLGRRRVHELSGGQKQRVALARALVNQPRVLLLDEPLAALDLKLRKQLQIELRQLQRRLGITFVHVTHDQEEALVLSDRIAVLRDGRIEQLGPARSVYERPRTRFVGQFLGSCSLIEATLAGPAPDGFHADTALGRLRVVAPVPDRNRFALAVRPEQLLLRPPTAGPSENHVPARVENVIYVGAGSRCELRAGATALHVDLPNRGPEGIAPGVGDAVVVEIPAASLVVLDD